MNERAQMTLFATVLSIVAMIAALTIIQPTAFDKFSSEEVSKNTFWQDFMKTYSEKARLSQLANRNAKVPQFTVVDHQTVLTTGEHPKLDLVLRNVGGECGEAILKITVIVKIIDPDTYFVVSNGTKQYNISASTSIKPGQEVAIKDIELSETLEHKDYIGLIGMIYYGGGCGDNWREYTPLQYVGYEFVWLKS